MSLLMDALRKAEESKRLAGETKVPLSAPEPTLETIGEPAAAAASGARSRLPDLLLHSAALDAELGAVTAETPSQRPAPAARFADGQREAIERDAARNVFAAKQPPAARPAVWLIIGLGALAALGIGAYFWWQLQSLSSGRMARPNAAPPVAAVAPAASTPAPSPQPTARSEAPQPRSAETLLIAQAPARAASVASPPAAIAAEPRLARTPRPAASAASGASSELRLSRSAPKTNETIERAYTSLHAGRLDEAHRDYEAALRNDPKNTDALLGLATIAARQGHNELAQTLYLRTLEADPNDATAQAGLLNTRGQADPALAESRLKSALASQPESTPLHFALGNLYARQQRWSEAQQAYFKAYASEPDNADVIYNLAVSLDHLRQNKLAAQYYQMALDATANSGRAVSFDRSQVSSRIAALWP